MARVIAFLPAGGEVSLTRSGPLQPTLFQDGPLAVVPSARRLDLRWTVRQLGTMEFGLVVLPGTSATVDDAIRAFEPLDIAWSMRPDGTFDGDAQRGGYRLRFTATPYATTHTGTYAGWLDVHAHLTRVADVTEPAGPAYVAVLRRVTTPSATHEQLRFNGRVFQSSDSPTTWSRDFWYTRGTDWISWRTDSVSIAAINGFTPVPTIQNKAGTWGEGSHFWVWERARRVGDQQYLISEIAGPNPGQQNSKYMPVTPYAPMRKGDALDLKWRLAIEQSPLPEWEESQLRVFAGRRAVTESNGTALDELGVGAVTFGLSYFPYSTFTENFDYYRTPGLNQETYWPTSPVMWSKWRMFAPRMQTDLHIIRAMGFDMVRLHHLELLQHIDRAEALAFLDFFTGEARELGLHILVDTEGPPEWVSLIASRYSNVVTRFEIENEVLIGGIKSGDAQRWTALYHAAKNGDPEAQVFFTSAGNNGMFERLRDLDVPFDRVGLHAYKHGPEWEEAYSSHMLGTAGYASDIGKDVTLGEFNWKELTRLAPAARLKEFTNIYQDVLEPRQIPEVFQFQFHESLAFNPAIGGSFTRHYEPLGLDRRPKPEAFETMRLIRKYDRPDAPVREVPIEISEAQFQNGRATVPFTVSNTTSRPVMLRLSALAFDGLTSRLTSTSTVTLQPGDVHHASVALRLTGEERIGTYHHFVRATYGGKASYGWGVVSNPGAPVFDKSPVLPDRVTYPQGSDVVTHVDWKRQLAVAFGNDASVIELEMAYTVANTLQSATGRRVWISSAADIPDSLLYGGVVVLVGTPTSNALIRTADLRAVAGQAVGHGVVALDSQKDGRQWLLLTGGDKGAVEAAAIDFVLRYWKNAKDATIRITGMERGAALGNRIGAGDADLP